MGTILSNSDIHRISTELLKDSEAVFKRKEICGSLDLLQHVEGLEQRFLYDNYSFFIQALTKYRSMKGSLGTVEKIIECLRKLTLTYVAEQIQAAGNTVSESIWFNVEYPVESFTGREDKISELHELITKNAGNATVKNQIFTVSGLGGIGKSEIAKKYARTFYKYYQENVICIDSESRESWRNSIQLLFRKHFKILEHQSNTMTDTQLIETIYNKFSNKKCLLILDNYEDFNVLKLLPTSPKPGNSIPNILITSRKSSWDYGIQVLQLDVLTEEEAVKFVEKHITSSMKNDIVKLVTVLQCFPLALQQAMAYIKARLSEKPNPIEIYLQRFDKQDVKNLLSYTNEESSTPNDKTTFSTWSVTLNTINRNREYGILATRIINLVSCLEPGNIPGCIFENMKSNPVESSDEVENAITLIKKYSMISGPPGAIIVHRLVQLVVRVRLNIENNIESFLGKGIEILTKYMHPHKKNDDLVKSLLPHAESIWKRSLQYPDLIRKYGYFSYYIYEKLEFYGRYVELMAKILFKKGLFEEVLSIAEMVYEARKRVLGEDHRLTLVSLKWLQSFQSAITQRTGRERAAHV